MSKLRLASFGIRGFIGESLSPRVIIDFASAFATFIGGRRVLLGCDTRTSSPMLHSATLSGLLAAGCEVLDFGICPTPMLQYFVKTHQAAGAVSISGGHNAMGWNAVTLIGADGAFLDPVGGETVLDCYHARGFLARDGSSIGNHVVLSDYATPYFEALAHTVNAEAIRAAHLTVLIDPVGGAGCPFLTPFADRLGLKLVPINAQPSGYLAREPEPRPRTAQQMASIIRHTGGHVGFVLSSDMGRLSLVTENGEPASEEYTLAVAANHLLSKQPGALVTNICTTRTVDDIAAARGVPVVKTRVGQAYIVAALMDEQGAIGGEGSGGVCVPGFSYAFDGFLTMALILDAVVASGEPLSALLHALPRYHIVKRTLPCGSRDGYRAIDILKNNEDYLQGGTLQMIDGMRVDWPDGWVHVRTSQTQQLVRVISEATSRAKAESRAEDTMRMVQQAI